MSTTGYITLAIAIVALTASSFLLGLTVGDDKALRMNIESRKMLLQDEQLLKQMHSELGLPQPQ